MLDVSVISRQQRFQVHATAAPVAVPAESLTFELAGDNLPNTVQLDWRTVNLVLSPDRSRGYFFLDASRSVGFHHLRVNDSDDFFFATDDAKLRLDGIVSLLQFLEHQGLSWGQQLFFSNGEAIRDPKVDFAWLARNVDEILRVAHEIAERPVRRFERALTPHQPTGARVHLQSTLASLRGQQKALLEEHISGPLSLNGRRYAPRAVVSLQRTLTVETIANRRITRLLVASYDLIHALMGERPPHETRKRLEDMRKRITEALRLYPFALLRDHDRPLTSRPAPEEMTDERYIRSYELHEELANGLAWTPGTKLANQFAYVAYSDQVYQAFVAVLLADGAGASATHRSLQPNLLVPSFVSDSLAIYYDTVPPRDRFHNWRDASSRPSDMRPDVTIVDTATDRGLLVDAKYRREGSRVDTRSLNECQVYMHSFGRRRLVVCYPGPGPSITSVSGDGNEILEVSLGPFDGVRQYVADSVWPAIQARMEPNSQRS